MSNVVSLCAYRKRREIEKQIESEGGYCSCGDRMERCDFYTDMHQGADVYYVCPSCLAFRITFEVNE